MTGLTRRQDAFGWGLFDHFRGRPSQEIIERDDGNIEGMDLTGYFAEYAAWPAHEKNALNLARGRVLDVGLGAGRVALHLQSQGLDVLGIDNSPLVAKVCKARGVKKVKLLPFNRISPKLGQFDTVVMYGNNFGLFGGFAQARRLLRRLHAMTTPNARILGSTLDPYQTSDPKHLAYHRRNRARGRMGGQIRLRVRYRDYATPWFDYLFVSRKELTGILKGTGWRLVRCFDGGNGRYVAVIEKSKGVT
jgi:SAM-dependent methyltransferase